MPQWLGLLGLLVLPAVGLDTAAFAVSAHGEAENFVSLLRCGFVSMVHVGQVSLVQRHVALSQSEPELVAYYINTDAEDLGCAGSFFPGSSVFEAQEKRRSHMEQQASLIG